MLLQKISVDEIRENGWNPNRMDRGKFCALVEAIRRFGFVQPLLVRRREDFYEVVDGAHRLRAAKEAGLTAVECVVVECDEEEAKLRTLMMNRLRGRFEPFALAQLCAEFDDAPLKRYLAFSEDELRGLASLLEEPEGVKLEVNARDYAVVFEVVLDVEGERLVERVLAEVQRRGTAANRGEALVVVCRHWLKMCGLTDEGRDGKRRHLGKRSKKDGGGEGDRPAQNLQAEAEEGGGA